MKQRPSLYRNCSIPLSCLFACLFLSAAGAQAQTLEQCRETYQGQLDIIAARHEEAIATAMESYRGGLHALRGMVQGLGDLDKTLVVRAEITRYVEKQTLPTSGSEPIPEIADLARQCRDRIQVANEARDKIVRDMQERYDRVLETFERRLTRDGDIEKALAMREERTLMQLSRATDDTGSLRPEPTPPETPVLRDPPVEAQPDPGGWLHTWRSVAGAEVVAAFEELRGDLVVLRRPDGSMVRIRMDQLVRDDQVLARGIVAGRFPRQGHGWTSPTTGMEFVEVKAGSFEMGSSSGGDNDERPVRKVRITRDFWMGKYEVTQREYQQLTGNKPSHFKGNNLPVETVSWDDAVRFCEELTRRERAAGRLPQGMVYRLPTEAEWEYAARGGHMAREVSYAGSNDINAVAWYEDNSGGKTQPVGTKAANELWLHDMSGNVWEWVHDWHQDSYRGLSTIDPTGPASGTLRVFRGGSWLSTTAYCRVANRYWVRPSSTSFLLGFRVVLAPVP